MAKRDFCPLCGLHREEPVVEEFKYPGDRLFPIADRLDALAELMYQVSEDIEISESAFRGLSFIMGDIKKMLVEETVAAHGDFIDLKKKGASAPECESTIGKGSKGLVTKQAPKVNLPKVEGAVN